MSQQLVSSPCCPSPCLCGDTFIINQTGGGGGGSTNSFQGAPVPNGFQTGNPGDWYRRDDGVNYEIWYKDSGTATQFGWVLLIKLA